MTRAVLGRDLQDEYLKENNRESKNKTVGGINNFSEKSFDICLLNVSGVHPARYWIDKGSSSSGYSSEIIQVTCIDARNERHELSPSTLSTERFFDIFRSDLIKTTMGEQAVLKLHFLGWHCVLDTQRRTTMKT